MLKKTLCSARENIPFVDKHFNRQKLSAFLMTIFLYYLGPIQTLVKEKKSQKELVQLKRFLEGDIN